MSTKLKRLLREYDTALSVSKKLPKLRKELVKQIILENMEGNKFRCKKFIINYHKYRRLLPITYTSIENAIKETYPGINHDKIIQNIKSKRKHAITETIKARPNKNE
jgi:hypothetical protein